MKKDDSKHFENCREKFFMDFFFLQMSFHPYKKLNDRLLYIHSLSNHPPNVKANPEFHPRETVEKLEERWGYIQQSKMWIRRCSDVWRKVGSKLMLNTPIINDKKQKIDLEILFGLTQHSTKQYPQMLQKYFFNWSADIFQSPIVYIKFSTQTQYRLVTVVCKIYPKYAKGIIVRLHPHRVTNWHYVTVVPLHQSHEKFSLGWQKENGRKSITNIKIHSTTNNIHTRRHFQVMGGIWRKL